jgi:hypothetical protein
LNFSFVASLNVAIMRFKTVLNPSVFGLCSFQVALSHNQAGSLIMVCLLTLCMNFLVNLIPVVSYGSRRSIQIPFNGEGRLQSQHLTWEA